MANASLKHVKLEDFSSTGSDSDLEGLVDEEAVEGPGDMNCEAEGSELNISQFVKAELLFDFEDSDSGVEREDEDHDWITTVGRTFSCALCKSSFSKSANLRSHIKTKHLTDKVVKCCKCDKIFKKQSNLKVHILNCHTEYDLTDCVCVQCGKRFKNPLSLKRHVETFHDEAKKAELTVTCPECGKKFNKKTNLKIHLECVHTTYKPGQFVCSLCEKELKNHYSLKSHLREVHAEKGEDKAEIFQCEECRKIFKKKKDLRGHKYAAHKVDLRICEVCSGKYKNQTALKQHLRLVHGPTETVSCELCFKSFKNLTRLKHHHLDVHKVDNSVCPDCGKTFKNRFLMKKHLRYLHRSLDGPRVRAVKEDSGYSSDVTSPSVSRKNSSEEKTESSRVEVEKTEESSSQSSDAGGVKREEAWSSSDNSQCHSQYHSHSQDSQINHGSYNPPRLPASNYTSGYLNCGYLYQHHHHQYHDPMAYFNQSDSLGPGLAAYQVMEQLELQNARRVTVMDQILQPSLHLYQ